MPDRPHKPRVAVLGAREEDMEILAELQRQDQVALVAVYDPDPHSPGLALAEIAGVSAGADAAARERLSLAEVIVLPSNRLAYQAAIDWCSGLRAELIGADMARQRWGGAQRAAPAPGTPKEAREFAAQMQELERLSGRVAAVAELGEWLLDAAMRAVGATGGSVQLLSPDTSELYLLAARGLAEDVVHHARHPLGEPISGLAAAMRTAQTLHGPQAARVPSQRGEVSAALCIPLATHTGQLVGVLNVSSTVPGRRFGAPELETLQRAAPVVASLLQQARTLAAGTNVAERQICDLLAALAEKNADLASTMDTVAQELCTHFDAEALSLHLATEAGDWLQLGASTRPGSPAPPPLSRALAGRALLQKQWVHTAEPGGIPVVETGDSVADAVERALSPADTSGHVRSWVVAPLMGTAPVGVLCAVFTRLATAEAFMDQGPPAVRHVAMVLETRVRERRLESRAARSAQLTQALPALVDACARGTFDAVLVREATRLAGAERALLRHVDEARRTYTRPIAHGVPEASAESWRTFDARVTESTLQRRRTDLRTLHGREERLDRAPRERSLVSVPILEGERIVAVLNVYDRAPQDPLEDRVFTPFDAEILETLGRIAGSLWPGRAAVAPPSSPSPPEPMADDTTSGAAIDAKRLRAELQREIARAERHQRPLGLSLVHVKGLEAVAEPERSRLIGAIDRLVREFVRRSDLIGWYGPDRLLIVTPEAEARSRELEGRIRQLLHEKLPATTTLGVRLGSSAYPRDGSDAAALLQAAVARLG